MKSYLTNYDMGNYWDNLGVLTFKTKKQKEQEEEDEEE